MISIEVIALVLTGLGLAASMIYYANILNNANKTRELQLKATEQTLETRQTNILMNLYTYQGSTEFQNAVQSLANAYEGMEWPLDPEEFIERNGPPDKINEVWKNFFRVCWYWNGLGTMVETNYANFETVYKLWGHQITWFWLILNKIIYYEREFFNQPRYFEWFEYLNNRIQEYEQTNQTHNR